MAIKELKTIIQLRRDTAANYELIKDSFIPRKGEIVLVDTASDGLRAKVGDGVSTYATLAWADANIYEAINTVVVRGYYLNGKFWTDSTYQVEMPSIINRIYIDKTSNVIFHYDGTKYVSVNETLPNASDTVAGIAKLYGDSGQNTDGSMTQKVITDGVNSISLITDNVDPECLVLDLPWD